MVGGGPRNGWLGQLIDVTDRREPTLELLVNTPRQL